MKVEREASARTQKRLLKAAGEVFAEKSYRDATIAEISERAGTNIAAVNYHFGNKETLYVETWRLAFHESMKAHPPDGGLEKNAPPEERLRAHMAAMVRRMADRNNREFLIVQREFANPTGLLEEVLSKEIHALHKRTEDLVWDLLGPHASEKDVQFCETSIISLCMNPMVAGRKLAGQGAKKAIAPIIKDIEAYIDHIVKFTLAGIGDVRKCAEAAGVETGSPGMKASKKVV